MRPFTLTVYISPVINHFGLCTSIFFKNWYSIFYSFNTYIYIFIHTPVIKCFLFEWWQFLFYLKDERFPRFGVLAQRVINRHIKEEEKNLPNRTIPFFFCNNHILSHDSIKPTKFGANSAWYWVSGYRFGT